VAIEADDTRTLGVDVFARLNNVNIILEQELVAFLGSIRPIRE